ncbi:unnamed protein product, partial [Rotaria magnacalcarata]
YTATSNNLQFNSISPLNTMNMAKPSANDIEQMIQRARPTNRDLVRRDINHGINSSISSLLLKIAPYFYNNGTSKDLLCLHGTVACQYKGNRYYIPIEIWFQQDHPNVPPLAYVKPTSDMFVSTASRDVQPDGTIIIPYIKNWRHPNSDLQTLLKAMSEAFSQSPPVYSNSNMVNRPTPYPINPPAMPMPTPVTMPMNSGGNPSYSYPYGYPQTQIPQDVYRDSVQTAVLDKVRIRLDEIMQMGKAQIDSLKKTEQDLIDGERKIQSFIVDAQQQQSQAQTYITNLQTKTHEMLEATQKMSSSSGKGNNSVKEDALITPAPVYKQLLQAYAEEHAMQDLLYYLADGLKRNSIGLDTYLKHVRELSRKQFILRATMRKCRQIAGLPLK